MIHVTCGPLEGILVCLCRTFLGVNYSMEKLCHFDLHGGLKTPRMDSIPHGMGRGPRSICRLDVIDVSFGGTWTTLDDDIIAPCTWTLSFGGLGRHSHARVLMGLMVPEER
jgi:hypothetical protein